MSSPGTTNLVSYHSLEEASGTRVDAHSGGWDLTDNNTVTQRTGKVGDAASFSGTNEYLDSSTSYGAAVGSSVTAFSCSFWMQADVTNSNDGVIAISTFSNDFGPFCINMGGSNNISFSFDNAAKQSTITSYTDTTNFNHFVISYNGTDYTIWQNDVKKFTAVSYSTALNFTGDKLTIGAYYSSSYCFDGGIDEVSIWNKALSDAEVTWLYNSGSGRSYADLSAGSSIKEINGLAKASIKSWNGVTIA